MVELFALKIWKQELNNMQQIAVTKNTNRGSYETL